MPFWPDKVILAGFSGNFALYLSSDLAEQPDNEPVIYLTWLAVNNPSLQYSPNILVREGRAQSQIREVFETPLNAYHAGGESHIQSGVLTG
jgi:hypothetical protein